LPKFDIARAFCKLSNLEGVLHAKSLRITCLQNKHCLCQLPIFSDILTMKVTLTSPPPWVHSMYAVGIPTTALEYANSLKLSNFGG
jgi:hypothetical protein